MHFHFLHFTIEQVLWALVLAAHLVLLVVLLGRERSRRFSWFTAFTMLSTVRLLADHLLQGKLTTFAFYWQSYALLLAGSLFLIGVLIEITRQTFGAGAKTGMPGKAIKPLSPLAWQGWSFLLLVLAGVALFYWGQWPDLHAMKANPQAYPLLITVVIALKSELFTDILAILVGLMVLLFGPRFGNGFKSHPVQIVIGLSTTAMARLAVERITDSIKVSQKISSREQYQHILHLFTNLDNARLAVWLLAIVWWIYWLWRDEPGAIAARTVDASDANQEPDSRD
uniref:Uncharacterized protein n=1 Tax=mine drainage metagenome TaxID=410659 RepID=E6PY40_9ZZZZ